MIEIILPISRDNKRYFDLLKDNTIDFLPLNLCPNNATNIDINAKSGYKVKIFYENDFIEKEIYDCLPIDIYQNLNAIKTQIMFQYEIESRARAMWADALEKQTVKHKQMISYKVARSADTTCKFYKTTQDIYWIKNTETGEMERQDEPAKTVEVFTGAVQQERSDLIFRFFASTIADNKAYIVRFAMDRFEDAFHYSTEDDGDNENKKAKKDKCIIQ